MKLLGKSKSVEEEIAEAVLKEDDRLRVLFEVLNHLPNDLVSWFKGSLHYNQATKNYVEVDLARFLHSNLMLPGDIVIRKNRDPKINDIIEIGMRNAEGYSFQMVKVSKINLKEGTLSVQDLLNSNIRGNVSLNNIICVIDKIIKYDDPEWKKLTQILNIDYDLDEIISWTEESIKYLKDNEKFHDKENNLKRLNERLKRLKNK